MQIDDHDDPKGPNGQLGNLSIYVYYLNINYEITNQ
jgi:hypothetical protein